YLSGLAPVLFLPLFVTQAWMGKHLSQLTIGHPRQTADGIQFDGVDPALIIQIIPDVEPDHFTYDQVRIGFFLSPPHGQDLMETALHLNLALSDSGDL